MEIYFRKIYGHTVFESLDGSMCTVIRMSGHYWLPKIVKTVVT